MKRSLRKRWEIVGLAGILFSLLVWGWSPGEEKAVVAPDAGGLGSAPGGPQPAEAAPGTETTPAPLLAIDTVVAMVNGEAITLDDLQRNSKAILAEWKAKVEKVAPETWPGVKERILRRQLENLIDRKLILMEAKELGARVEESRVREFIMSLPEIKMSYDGDLAKYLVAKEISYGQLYRDIEEYLLFRGILRQNVAPKTRVPPGEVRLYYERNIDKFTEEAAIHCFAISFIKRGNPEAAAAVLTKAREALRKIKEGAYFPDVAKEYSEDPKHAEKGGDWGWITPGTLEKKASDAAFALKENEYSGIVEGDAAHWILWVKEKRERSVVPLSAAWREIELYIKMLKQEMEIRRWGRRLRLKAAVTYPVPLSAIVRR